MIQGIRECYCLSSYIYVGILLYIVYGVFIFIYKETRQYTYNTTDRIIELVIIMTQVENSIIIIYTVYIYE